jgi:hypothetical protein
MKLHADTKCIPWQFQICEQVLLKLQPYAQSSVVNSSCPKLAWKYFGPLGARQNWSDGLHNSVTGGISGASCIPCFTIEALFTPDFTPVFSALPSVPQLDLHELEPELILDRCLSKNGNAAVTQVLIKWTSLPNDLVTWEDYEVVKHRYPAATALGHAASQGGSNVVTSTQVANDM